MGKFKIGDTVRLKSGSPVMTVRIITQRDGRDAVSCTYFYEGKFYGLDGIVLINEELLEEVFEERGAWFRK
ncbi:DUF2158 domain-containing protein [Hymenobacter metallicola]|uniref:DUF2158 domain-containing protein n=1 Tax=Hymenobacter metallicola TaxID=2563114 RepID=A0A4Z0Q1M8_9BACT|nr:DUF2158 domain-containing protein [Hymenobacter metallicola]